MQVGVKGSQKGLSFPVDSLSDPSFNAQAFIAELRTHAPLRVVRDDLRSHIAALQQQIVTTLQSDFQTFSTLNTSITDADNYARNAQTPLETLHSTLKSLRTDLDDQINTLDATLAQRRAIKDKRNGLQTLLHSNELLSKCERLLREYSALPATSEERLRLVERIAGEAAQLSFVLARSTQGAFIDNISVRVSAVRRGVRNCLDAWLRRALFESSDDTYDTEVLPRVLAMYVVAGLATEAEDFFRREVVAPFTSTRLRMATMLSAAERKKRKGVTAADALQAAEEEIVDFLGEKVMPLVSLCDSEERLRSRLDFVGRAVWPQIEKAISSHMAAAFSPGIPDVFHQSVLAGGRIYAAVEAAVGDDILVEELRKSKSTSDFWRHWNLPVYFQLRFQEITSRFDQLLTEGPVALSSSPLGKDDWGGSGSRLLRTDVYRATPTASLVASLRRCWSEEVFLPSLTHRFLRLSLQLLARFSTWVRTGLAGEWAAEDSVPKGAARVFCDIGVLQKRIPAELSSVLRLRASALEADLLDNLDTAFADAVDSYSSLLPDLSRSITDSLARNCVDNLQPLRGILATYRMSSKQAPSTHSSFVPKILRPLRTFLKEHEDSFDSIDRIDIATAVIERTAEQYHNMATDLLQRNKSSEATLRRLNIGRSGALAGSGANVTSVIEKISIQLYLDVEKFTDEVRSLGVAADNVTDLNRLRESVKREENDETGQSETKKSDGCPETSGVEQEVDQTLQDRAGGNFEVIGVSESSEGGTTGAK